MSDTLTIVGAAPGEEFFIHEVWGTFNVSRIERHLEGVSVFNLAVSAAMLHQLGRHNVDHQRIEGIQADPARMAKPILVIDCEDGTHLIIDGSHRAYARWRLGHDTVPGRIVTLSEVRPFMVHFYDGGEELSPAVIWAMQEREGAAQ
jgi:hypothetical protein